MPSAVATPHITTYDLVKTLAIVLTVLDHIGFFFYPENDWFRVIGRACVPVWCFLIGYASSRDTGKDIWIWATALLASNIVFGGNLFPLNILFTFIAIRLVIDRMASVMFRNWEVMLYAFTALALLIIPTMLAVEYGTSALLLALAGYAVRHRDDLPVSLNCQRIYIGAAISVFTLMQLVLFPFDSLQSKTCAFLVGASGLMMYFFKPLQFPSASTRLPGVMVDAVQFTGRYTMEIYVIHLVLFKGIAAYYGLEKYGFFDWVWIR
jgi:hypothetical protein